MRWALLAALACAGAARAEDKREVPPKIKALLEKSEQERKDRMRVLREVIVQLDAKIAQARKAKQPAEVLQGRLQDAQNEMKSLMSGAEIYVPDFDYPPEVGQIGRLGTRRAKVVQVVDDRSMLIMPYLGGQQLLILVRGASTAAVADGLMYAFPDVFEVTGTHRYETVGGGSRTVLVIEPFDIKKVEPFRQPKAAKP